MTHDAAPSALRARLHRRLAILAVAVLILGGSLAIRYTWGTTEASADPPLLGKLFSNNKEAAKPAPQQQPAGGAPTAPTGDNTEIMAYVNNQAILRSDLAKECLRHRGEEVLESLTNKHLIAQHCAEKGITVTHEEVEAEIQRMADRFGLPKQQWLTMLEKERNITPTQYARDIIWPTVALRKLASERLTVTEQELQEAYETQFGPAVQTRLIAVSDRAKALEVHEMAVKDPSRFAALARQYSEDANSASANGLIQPIRRHLGDPKIEQVAFALKPGEVSDVIEVDGQYVILKCDRHIPPTKAQMPMETVRRTLEEAIRDKKLRLAAGEVFAQLQADSKIEVVLNDPQKRKQHPGVAAIVNGRQMMISELADECIERHGIEVLQGVINRTLLEQECKKRNIEVTRADMDAEIARAASSMGMLRQDGAPDVEAWLKDVTEVQGIPLEIYERDTVWPTCALKKLVTASIEVTEEDLHKGFEANFGPRVRCRAIVCNQLRKAQDVWAMARENPTIEHFGDLAEQYSVETSSRTLRGEIPPIQKHGGQPLLEEHAFSLQPGELSGIIQVGENYVILMCEGYTEPTNVEFAEVRDHIYQDIFEKKLRLAMASEFTRIQDSAKIDNFLAKTSQSPKKPAGAQNAAAGKRPATQTARGPVAPAGPNAASLK